MTAPSASTRILVVDDDKSVRDALTRLLTQRGYAVESAPTGEDALKQLAARKFNVMLLDVRMPGISGIDVLPRALDLHADLVIIMLTGVSDLTTAARAMQRGARDFLTKPIDLAQLTAAIDRTLVR